MTRYTNYVMKNNVFAELEAPIGSLATTIQLKEGQGARWGNEFPILATLENFDSNGKCTKREIVRITAVNGDNLTVVRGVAPCPSSDDSNSQGTSTYSFQADDKISLYITKEHFDKIEDGFTNTNEEIDDLHENGTDELRTYATTGLGVEVKPGKVLVGSSYYDFEGGTLTLTNNATNYIEIDEDGNLVVNTTGWIDENSKVSKVITSGGEITSIEDWRLATVGGKIGGVNIHDLTEKTVISADDEFIIADSENIYQNKKVKFSKIGGALSYLDDILAGEDLSRGDVLLNTSTCFSKNLVENSIDFGGDNTKIAIKQISNGQNISEISFLMKATSGSTATGLTLNIESDNSGSPSGTALSTQDIYDYIKTIATPVTGTQLNYDYSTNYMLGMTQNKCGSLSKNGMYFFSTNYYNNGFRPYILTLATPFDFGGGQSASSQNQNFSFGTGNTQGNYVDSEHIIVTQGTSTVGLYYMLEADPNTISLLGTMTADSGVLFDSVAMSEDGLKLYIVAHNSSRKYTIYSYSLSTAFDLSNRTLLNSTDIVQSNNYTYCNITLCEGYVIIMLHNSNQHKMTVYVAYIGDNGNISSISAGGGDFAFTYYNNALCALASKDGKYIYNTYSQKGYRWGLGTQLDTTLKERNITIETPQTIAVGSTYWITFTPTGGSGDRFSLGYISRSNNYHISNYNGSSWSNDTSKYPFLENKGNSGLFWKKGSMSNKSPSNKGKIVKSNVSKFNKVFYDFDGISDALSGLIPGVEYFLTGNGLLTSTPGGGYKIGTAMSETQLLLDGSKKSYIAGSMVYVLDVHSKYQISGLSTNPTFISDATAPHTGEYRFYTRCRPYSYTGISVTVQLKINGTVKGTITISGDSNWNTDYSGVLKFKCNTGDIINVSAYTPSTSYTQYLLDATVSYSIVDYNDSI